jgi:cell division protein FtsB
MSKSLVRALFIACNVAVVIGLTSSVFDLWKRRDIVRDRQAALEKVRGENRRLKEALADAQTPEFVEREARNRLNLGKPGETIIIMEAVPEATWGGQLQAAELPTWRAWWRLFF